jgi:hypothetical protein
MTPAYSTAITKALANWPGREFRAGDPAQCMNFVRHILRTIHAPLATAITAAPLDGHWTGPELASSLAGKDIGSVIGGVDALQPGDILFFDDTYHVPGFGAGTITHVAISTGGASFTHRPTSARPVERATLTGYWLDKFRCGIRPTNALTTLPDTTPATDPEPARVQWSVYAGTEKVSKLLDKVSIDANGRATMTAQVLAALTNHTLVINTEAKAIRFQPIPKRTN